MQPPQKAKLGFWTATSIVTGNMIGSGIFLLPSALAMYGGISLGGWVFSALGSLALAYVFASLAKYVKGSGGPYIYSRHAFGKLTGFMVAWGYWICIIAANAAIAIALVSYLSVFFPILKQQENVSALATLFFLWLLVLVNLLGIKYAGRLSFITTLLKLLPLIAIGIVGCFYLQPNHFQPFNLSQDSNFGAVAATAALTMWAFLGLESASNIAGEVENPEKNIPRATVLGTLIAAVVYISGSIAVMGLVAPDVLINSNAPYADAAAILWGDMGYYIFAVCAVISCFGALNGWTLCVGQVAKALAEDELFPKLFAEQSKRGVPTKGIVISTAIVSCLVLMNYNQSLVEQFSLVILLSTLTTVLPYVVCTLGHMSMSYGNDSTIRQNPNSLSLLQWVITLIAFLFSLWIISNIGLKTISLGIGLLIIGLPIYFLMERKQKYDNHLLAPCERTIKRESNK